MFEIARNNINKIAFCKERILDTSRARRDAVGIDILIISNDSYRKIMQLIRITNGPFTSIRTWN